MSTSPIPTALLLGALGAVCACGGGATGSTSRYLELKEGARWTYRITDDDGKHHEKTNAVEALEDVGGRWAGTLAHRVKTTTADETNLSWQADTGSAIRRLRDKTYDDSGTLTIDESYEPYKLRLDETRLTAGQSWPESYTEYKTDLKKAKDSTNVRIDQWTVEATDEEITVPAGTYRCLRLHRVSLETSSEKRYWFAPGVGKIKEAGGQTEELAAYSPGP